LLRAAAKQFGWEAGRRRAAPGAGRRGGRARFRLPAIGRHFIALIAEVRVHRDSGVIEIPRWSAP